jgi:hypothetical protein
VEVMNLLMGQQKFWVTSNTLQLVHPGSANHKGDRFKFQLHSSKGSLDLKEVVNKVLFENFPNISLSSYIKAEKEFILKENVSAYIHLSYQAFHVLNLES